MPEFSGSVRSPQLVQFLAASVDEAAQGILAFDMDCRYILWNRRMEEITGKKKEDVLGRSAFEVFPVLLAMEEDKFFYGALAGKSAESLGRNYPVGKGGSFDVSYRPIRNDQGDIIGGMAHFRDCARQVRAAEQLRHEAEILDTMIRTAETVSGGLDLDKVVQAATDAATQVSGAQFGAFFYNVVNDRGESYMLYTISGVPKEAFSKFPMPRNTEVFAPTFRGDGVVRVGNIKKDPRYGKNAPRSGMPEGHLPVCSYLAVPVMSRSGDEVFGGLFFGHSEADKFTEDSERLVTAIARLAAISIENARLYDSERRARARAEESGEQFRKAEERLRLIATSTDVGTWYCDLPFSVLEWSAKTKEHFWLPEDAAVTIDTFYERIHPDDRERTQRAIATSIEENRLYDVDYRTMSDSGQIKWIHAIGRTFYDKDKKPIRFDGITLDQTDRRNADEALRRSERLATAGRLAATVAHEVNNPLEAVTNLIYLCQHDPEVTGRIRSHLDVADEELRRVAHIVRQTLGFYRENSAPQRTNVAELISNLIEVYRRRYMERRVTLRADLDNTISAYMVSGEIRQVIANLLSNALDACAEGGDVTVTLRKRGRNVEMEVADTGYGISNANQAKLFEPFFTTKTDVGTGLGLWVSKGIVEKHGGELRVKSSTDPESHGTVFTIVLPAQPNEIVGSIA